MEPLYTNLQAAIHWQTHAQTKGIYKHTHTHILYIQCTLHHLYLLVWYYFNQQKIDELCVIEVNAGVDSLLVTGTSTRVQLKWKRHCHSSASLHAPITWRKRFHIYVSLPFTLSPSLSLALSLSLSPSLSVDIFWHHSTCQHEQKGERERSAVVRESLNLTPFKQTGKDK